MLNLSIESLIIMASLSFLVILGKIYIGCADEGEEFARIIMTFILIVGFVVLVSSVKEKGQAIIISIIIVMIMIIAMIVTKLRD